VSQMTSGRLMASHIRVRLEGVCDHWEATRRALTEEEEEAAAVRDAGEEGVGDAVAVELRVERLVGERVLSAGSGNSRGWFLVATIVMAKGWIRRQRLARANAETLFTLLTECFSTFLYSTCFLLVSRMGI